jgi:hypothetical protein
MSDNLEIENNIAPEPKTISESINLFHDKIFLEKTSKMSHLINADKLEKHLEVKNKPFRNEVIKQSDKELIGRLLISGMTLYQVQRDDRLSHISKDLIKEIANNLKAELKEITVFNLDALRFHKFQELELLKDEALKAFELSKTQGIKKTWSINTVGGKFEGLQEGESEETPKPDVNFLNTAKEIIKTQCKLLGLDAPLKIDAKLELKPITGMRIINEPDVIEAMSTLEQLH